jgi:hypothetical protein
VAGIGAGIRLEQATVGTIPQQVAVINPAELHSRS